MNCQAELRGLGAINDELAELGVDVVAVSVDPPARSMDVVQRWSLPFPILADEDARLIRAFGVLHPDGGPQGDIALPASFLVDRDARVIWKHVATRIHDRLGEQEVLAEVRAALARRE